MNKKLKTVAVCSAALGSIIIPGGESFAEAASSQTDNINITVSSSCTVDRTAGTGTYSATMVSGAVKEDIGSSTLKVVCNSPSGWKLQAIGAGTTSHTTELYSTTTGTTAIPTATSGTSYWAFKVTGTDSTATAWTAVPSAATTVAKSTSTTDGSTLTTTYKVQLAPAQAAGTYTGKVTYTVSAGAA